MDEFKTTIKQSLILGGLIIGIFSIYLFVTYLLSFRGYRDDISRQQVGVIAFPYEKDETCSDYGSSFWDKDTTLARICYGPFVTIQGNVFCIGTLATNSCGRISAASD